MVILIWLASTGVKEIHPIPSSTGGLPVKCAAVWLSSGLWLFSIIIHARFISIFPVSPKCQFNTLLLIQSQSSQNKSVHLKLEIKKNVLLLCQCSSNVGKRVWIHKFMRVLWKLAGWQEAYLECESAPFQHIIWICTKSVCGNSHLLVLWCSGSVWHAQFSDLIRLCWNISASFKNRLVNELTLHVLW